MKYDGPARVGDNDSGVEVWVQIIDVEDPNWVGSVPNEHEHNKIPLREVTITLTGRSIYAGWSGTTRLTRPNARLLGLAPFIPPIRPPRG